jgi:two-component system response regulator LytT
MKILIVEDEPGIVRGLSALLLKIDDSIIIDEKLDSVESAVNYLKKNKPPDLIFMDIHLADGLSFEIFKQVHISSPVVFLTAFDEYAIEAFKVNSIDYILKPFTEDAIKKSLNKFQELTKHFGGQKEFSSRIEEALSAYKTETTKTTFLIQSADKYIPVPVNDIAYFCVNNGITCICTFEGKKYNLTCTLDEAEKKVSDKRFYRANRQFIINCDAVREIQHYFNRKLTVKLKVPVKEAVIISKARASHFLKWMENHQ